MEVAMKRVSILAGCLLLVGLFAAQVYAEVGLTVYNNDLALVK